MHSLIPHSAIFFWQRAVKSFLHWVPGIWYSFTNVLSFFNLSALVLYNQSKQGFKKLLLSQHLIYIWY